MRGDAEIRDPSPRWSLIGSVLFHAAFLVTAVFLLKTVPPEPLPLAVLEIEILSPEQLTAMLIPQPMETPAAPEPPPPAEPAPEPAPDEPGMIRPSQLLSAGVLANPANAQALRALPTLAGPERMEQLCNIEAMEQVHAWREELSPDRLVAYALLDTEIERHTVIADGGAIRIGRRWYDIAYRCALSPDHKSVLDFEFMLGEPIPENDWDSLYLPVGD